MNINVLLLHHSRSNLLLLMTKQYNRERLASCTLQGKWRRQILLVSKPVEELRFKHRLFQTLSGKKRSTHRRDSHCPWCSSFVVASFPCRLVFPDPFHSSPASTNRSFFFFSVSFTHPFTFFQLHLVSHLNMRHEKKIASCKTSENDPMGND